MPTFKLTLAYDGTAFVGWQRQLNGPSVQGLLETAFAELDGADRADRADGAVGVVVAVLAAGRTDAGVHALGQVASVTLTRAIDAATVVSAINVRLPETVRILDALQVDDGFHARFHAKRKMYRYRIWNAPVMNPFEHRYAWHLPGPLDVDAMAAGATVLEGRHDFAAMQAAGSDVQSTEREILSSRITRGPDALVTYEVAGTGFLRHMVRNITGTLAEVGRGRRPVEWVREVLDSRERAQAGPTAPAHGLFLVRVEYD